MIAQFLFSIVLVLICISLAIVLLTLIYLAIKTLVGKSISDPIYPPVKGTVLSLVFNYSRMYDYLTDLAADSPTFRLLTPAGIDVFTVDIRNVEHVTMGSFESFSKGKRVSDVLEDLLGEGIFVVDGQKWKKQRKLASFQFSTGFLRDFSCVVFREKAVELARVVHGFSLQNKVFDMHDLLMRCTLDSISKVGFGVELNCLEGSNKEGLAFMKAIDDVHSLLKWRYIDPFWKLKKVLNIGSEAILKKDIRFIHEFMYQLIRKRKKVLEEESHCKEREDILSRCLVESKKNSEEMNDNFLRDMVLSFLFAGKDTSANTLTWFFYILSKSPLVQGKVVQEIIDVYGDKSDETNIEKFVENITEETLNQMHYLHATLSETLRLYPTVPLGSRFANRDNVLPDGFKVRKGEGVFYSAYAMGRRKELWGDDAEDFRPERWLKDRIFHPESPFKFPAFYAGPRMCLAKDFAYQQMKVMTIALLRFFNFKLADKSKPAKYKVMFTLHIEGGLSLSAVPRNSISTS